MTVNLKLEDIPYTRYTLEEGQRALAEFLSAAFACVSAKQFDIISNRFIKSFYYGYYTACALAEIRRDDTPKSIEEVRYYAESEKQFESLVLQFEAVVLTSEFEETPKRLFPAVFAQKLFTDNDKAMIQNAYVRLRAEAKRVAYGILEEVNADKPDSAYYLAPNSNTFPLHLRDSVAASAFSAFRAEMRLLDKGFGIAMDNLHNTDCILYLQKEKYSRCTYLYRYGLPVITLGQGADFFALVHECGHAYAFTQFSRSKVASYVEGAASELPSMLLEALTVPLADKFFSDKNACELALVTRINAFLGMLEASVVEGYPLYANAAAAAILFLAKVRKDFPAAVKKYVKIVSVCYKIGFLDLVKIIKS